MAEEAKVAPLWSQAKAFDAVVERGTTVAAPQAKAKKAAKVIFVPGHWHTEFHAQPLLQALRARGVAADAHQLESVGLKQKRPTFKSEVKMLTDMLINEIDAGEDIVLVCHSAAGMSGAEAVNQLMEHLGGVEMPEAMKSGKGGLRRYVQIASYCFPAGVELDARQFVGPEDPSFRITDDGMTQMLQPYEAFFTDMSREDAQPFLDRLVPVYCLIPPDAPVTSSENWRKARLLYVLCERDRAMPKERQELISQGMEVLRLDTAHDPFVSDPQLVADLLEKIAWEL